MTGVETQKFEYAHGIVGKRQFRVREAYIAGQLLPLIRTKAVGAAKLDLVLRGIAIPSGEGTKPTRVGLIRYPATYRELHDLCRRPNVFGEDLDDPKVLDAKRKWVAEQLVRLEQRQLVRRVKYENGKRPELFVLRDDGSAEPFDDPGTSESDRYVRLVGDVVASGAFRAWGAPELCAYIAAMYAERWADLASKRPRTQPGTGKWFQPLAWFANADGRYGPPNRSPLPFSVKTLERGMSSLCRQGLLDRNPERVDPFRGTRFRQTRIIYTNGFTRKPNDQPAE